FVPVNRSFNAWITRAKKVEALFDPLSLPDTGLVDRKRKFAGRPLGDHDWLRRIEAAHFPVRPIHKWTDIRIWFVFKLLPVNAQAEPIDVVGAGIIRRRE